MKTNLNMYYMHINQHSRTLNVAQFPLPSEPIIGARFVYLSRSLI